MRTCGYIFLALLAAWPSASAQGPPAPAPAKEERPAETVFARGGGKAMVALTPINLPSMTLALRAYGRAWTKAEARNEKDKSVVEFEVPVVRVPMVFSITSADKPEIVVGEVVAYPDQNVAWDKKTVLYSCGAPKWFDQWAAATGLPVKRFGPADQWDVVSPADAETKALLILGPSTAEKSFAAVLKLARQKELNLLVLDADWFGEPGGAATVAPAGMHEGLAEIDKQSWPQPLKFATHRRPWSGIANRWAWIMDEKGLPLVEAVAHVDPPPPGSKEPISVRPVLLSYLPWATQLGRNESADATLLALLAAAAKAKPKEMTGHPVRFIYPEKKDLDKKTRPVLAAIHSVDEIPDPLEIRKPDYHGPFYYIVDLRGKERLEVKPQELSRQCFECAESAAATTLIILGDKPMLDEWKWLKIDRVKKTMETVRAHSPAVWLPDNEFPPSGESQVKLMLALTRLGVLLAPPGEEEKKK